ncbi:MAG: SprB repeat-containing protein, partial [Bacteroidales bacterium]|nr:SprB repeat-containing protein [Bacteroidales bacterium]
MKHFILFFLTVFISLTSIIESFSQNRYWVNGSGSWEETSHWSETSGGKPGASVPAENNNVIFDSNSFANNNHVVLIKKTAICNDFIWEVDKPGNTIKSSSFIFKSLSKAEISVCGSILINDNIKNEYYGDIVFAGSNKSSININSEFNSDLIFNNEKGNWKFDSEFKTSGDIYLVSGDLSLNDNNIECNTFSGSGTEKRSVDLGNSVITANKWDFEVAENLSYTGNDYLISLKTDNLKANLLTGDLPVKAEKAGTKAPFIVYPFVVIDATCYGGSDGTFTMSVEGGTKPYTYTLKNNRTSVTQTEVTSDTIWTFIGLTADEYYAKVEHAGGGVFGDTYDVGQPLELKALKPTVSNPLSCYDGNDGELTAERSGGTPPYTYQWLEWNDGASKFDTLVGETNRILSNIAQGIYRVYVDDANSCGAGGAVLVDFPFIKPPRDDSEIPPQIVFDSYSSTDECGVASDGTIDISASGGTGDMDYYLFGQTDGLTYPVAPPPYDEDGSFTGLSAQTYETYAVDANGCEKQGADVIIISLAVPIANAGSGGDECDFDFDLNAVPSAGTGTWTYAGPGLAGFTPNVNDPNATVTVDTYGSYNFTWTEDNGSCTDADMITVNFYEQPIADAGSGGDECDFDFVLSAVPSVGTGTWTFT